MLQFLEKFFHKSDEPWWTIIEFYPSLTILDGIIMKDIVQQHVMCMAFT